MHTPADWRHSSPCESDAASASTAPATNPALAAPPLPPAAVGMPTARCSLSPLGPVAEADVRSSAQARRPGTGAL